MPLALVLSLCVSPPRLLSVSRFPCVQFPVTLVTVSVHLPPVYPFIVLAHILTPRSLCARPLLGLESAPPSGPGVSGVGVGDGEGWGGREPLCGISGPLLGQSVVVIVR